MKTLSILKAGVAVALAAVVSLTNVSLVLAQQEVPLTDVGGRSLLQSGQYFSIWEERLPDPEVGFRAYNVLFKVNEGAPAGTFINAFSDLNITGVHQVWEAPRRSTNQPVESPYAGTYEGFADKLQALDSSVMFDAADENNGASPSEDNDATNPAGIDPETYDPESGFVAALPLGQFGADSLYIGNGEVGIVDRSGTVPRPVAALGLNTTNGELNFARVVLWDGLGGGYVQASLMGEIGGEGNGNPSRGEIDAFTTPVLIGQTRLVPEPAMGLLGLVGCVSLIAARRRRG